ncbi:MAG TPA: diphthamide synthesis protein, partial [Methanocorpusculum sp.]|nr:diphthamide synthesis protein [Methanocorpusculum sp.]
MIQLTEVITELKNRNAKRVAVQFPEGLKRKAAVVASTLKNEGFEVLICGDACWGACDLSLDALEWADVLVHIGHTPVTAEKNVIYLPFQQDIPLEILESAISELKKYSSVAITTTIQHAHQTKAMCEWLKDHGVNAVIGVGSSRTPLDGQVLGCTYASAKNADADAY